MDLKWDYENKTVTVGMKGYNEKTLKEAGNTKPDKSADGPNWYTWPEYSKKIQYAENDTSPFLSEKKIKRIHKLAGKFYIKVALSTTLSFMF